MLFRLLDASTALGAAPAGFLMGSWVTVLAASHCFIDVDEFVYIIPITALATWTVMAIAYGIYRVAIASRVHDGPSIEDLQRNAADLHRRLDAITHTRNEIKADDDGIGAVMEDIKAYVKELRASANETSVLLAQIRLQQGIQLPQGDRSTGDLSASSISVSRDTPDNDFTLIDV